MKVTKSSQLYLTAPDEVGQLARVLSVIADAGVNGQAYAGYSEGGQGHMMVVTADNEKVIPLLQEAGYEVREEPVVLVTDTDAVGSGLGIAKKVADAGISLTGAYATAAGGEYLTVLQAAEIDQLLAALQ
jgi:hypothetical protein